MRLPKCVCGLVFSSILALTADGLAQPNALPQISAIDATNYVNQQVVVVDRVAQVSLRPSIWLLHLNQRFPNSPLSAVIRKGDTNNFPNINDYLGQRVQITGRINDFKGRLEIALSNPNEIKILSSLPAQQLAAIAPVVAPAAASQSISAGGDRSTRTTNYLLALLAIIVGLLAAGVFIVWRRPREFASRPLPPRPLAIVESQAVESPSVEVWKQRALVAEAMAGQQGQLLREKIIPELTEFAKQSLVQGLYAQRNILLETQLKAQQALVELEARLNSVQAPLQERIRAYEKRIAELERELETQGDEVRELTRATLLLVRRKLEDEREYGRLNSRLN